MTFIRIEDPDGWPRHTHGGFEIRVTPKGIRLSGELAVESQLDLNPFAKAVATAWQEHQARRLLVVTDEKPPR
jgi:hypothetical protein